MQKLVHIEELDYDIQLEVNYSIVGGEIIIFKTSIQGKEIFLREYAKEMLCEDIASTKIDDYEEAMDEFMECEN